VTDDAVAKVLALVSSQDEVAEPDLPVPPPEASAKAQALWYAVLGTYELDLGEMLVLESLVATQSHLDEIESDWRRDGSPTTAEGSMGQPVTDPRIQEMRLLRAQAASLVKQLALPSSTGSGQRKRPGRPTRLNQGGTWGTRGGFNG
jgi:hypothetical protein